MKHIKCPICRMKLLVVFNEELFEEDVIEAKIKVHINNHSLGDFLNWINGNFWDQVIAIERELMNLE